MFEYRHLAYNLTTGQIINCQKGNYLKKMVAYTKKVDKEIYDLPGQWRFCHDYGRKWENNGYPER